MTKNIGLTAAAQKVEEWNPNNKESWHKEFENKPVNEDRWSCLVTAAVQAEVQADECIQIYNQYAATGLRRAIRTITMADVISLLKGTDQAKEKVQKDKLEKENGKKKQENGKTKQENGKTKNNLSSEESSVKKYNFSPPPVDSRIVTLAAKYATYNEFECKLPPDLMACVIKYLILKIKNESILSKKIAMVKNQRKREETIKANLFNVLRPYEPKKKEEEGEISEEPIDDEPVLGADMYILMSDFFNVVYLTELVQINVPVTAILRIVMRDTAKGSHTSMRRWDMYGKKSTLLNEFWESLKNKCAVLNETILLKDILMMQYQAPVLKTTELKQITNKLIFEEISWMQYSAYFIHRQHQYYLQESYVQRMFMSVEPLELAKCNIYNKLCDALITGEPNTPLLVLYALIEQVVAGIPYVESYISEYDQQPSNYFYSKSEKYASTVDFTQISDSRDEKYTIGNTPCKECRNKTPCCKLSEKTVEKETAVVNYDEETISQHTFSTEKSRMSNEQNSYISENFISEIILAKKSEKDVRKEKKWRTPKLCFFGDNVTLQYYHCDPRLINTKDIIKRFFSFNILSSLWAKYPVLPPADRAFYNYHFLNLWKISQESQALLKVKIFFALSMKLIGVTKSYLYKGEDENISEMFGMVEREKKLSKVRFGHNAQPINNRSDEKNLSNYFFKNFILDLYFQNPRKTVIIMNSSEKIKSSLIKVDSHSLRKFTSQYNIHLVAHRSIGACFSYCVPCTGSTVMGRSFSVSGVDKSITTLFSLLDCYEISNMTEPQFLGSKEDYSSIIKNFHFFEHLTGSVLTQRFLDAQEKYNSIQCSHFPPTDTLLVIMYNEHDYRGIFYTSDYGALLTPVALRDFYSYVYPEINDWLVEEENNYWVVVAKVKEDAKELERKKDSEYLAELKKTFCSMSEEEKENFLKEIPNTLESEKEITLEDLPELPKKPKLNPSTKRSFVLTNLGEMRLETQRKVNEYHSKDGTEVSAIIDSWFYEPVKLLSLSIKKSKLKFSYHHYIRDDVINTNFSIKTSSNIIFVFDKNNSILQSSLNVPEEENGFNHIVKISWPTGLLIEVVPHGQSEFYVKQGYINVYRKTWEIAEENFRCCLKNGQVLIFKENGQVDVLCASGEKHVLLEFEKPKFEGSKHSMSQNVQSNPPISVSQYESTLGTGEVWKKVKGSCRTKIILSHTYKIYMGTDVKLQETFYKREDGVSCMLWPCGKLVTIFPDGTKITSRPHFDEKDIELVWTEEEKISYTALLAKKKSQTSKSRTSMKKDGSETTKIDFFEVESFVSITCSYLMEHPKYTSVFFNPRESFALALMPEGVSLKIYPNGNYEVKQKLNVFRVQNNELEFFTNCLTCENKSTATINLDSSKILCRFTDFFQREFCVLKDGTTEFYELKDDEEYEEKYKLSYGEKISTVQESDWDIESEIKCDHIPKPYVNQRCFAFERDYTGYEFPHDDCIALDSYNLPNDTFYDLSSKSEDESLISHTFSSPYSKIGYENWLMEYEDKDDLSPTNLKKKDLKEVGGKVNIKKFFEVPFPKAFPQNVNKNALPREKPEMPKVVVTRIIKRLSQEPNTVIEDLQKYVNAYQQKAQNIWGKYKNQKISDVSRDAKYVQMRLRKIALALSQKLQMYPHLCETIPSTDKEIHYFGHFINSMEEVKTHDGEGSKYIPDCKQIPRPLPKDSQLNSIPEENGF